MSGVRTKSADIYTPQLGPRLGRHFSTGSSVSLHMKYASYVM